MPELAQFLLECWVRRFVESDAGANTLPIDSAEFAVEDDAVILNAKDGGSLFEVAVFARIEDDSVSGFKNGDMLIRGNVEANPAILSFDDCTKEGASLLAETTMGEVCLLYTSPSPRDLSTSRMPSSA